MRSAFWKFRSDGTLTGREQAVAVAGIVACAALVTAVMASEQRIRPQAELLYIQSRDALSAELFDPLVWRMENFLSNYAVGEYPPVPNQLLQEVQLLASLNPQQFRQTLIEIAKEQDIRLVKAVAYCLKIGLDNKGATIALQLLEQQHSSASPMLREIFVRRGLDGGGTMEVRSEWIPHAVDQFWYMP